MRIAGSSKRTLGVRSNEHLGTQSEVSSALPTASRSVDSGTATSGYQTENVHSAL
jgi:hypothetical protein